MPNAMEVEPNGFEVEEITVRGIKYKIRVPSKPVTEVQVAAPAEEKENDPANGRFSQKFLDDIAKQQAMDTAQQAQELMMDTNRILRIINVCIERTSRLFGQAVCAKPPDLSRRAALHVQGKLLKKASRHMNLGNKISGMVATEAEIAAWDKLERLFSRIKFTTDKFIAKLRTDGLINQKEIDWLMNGLDIDGKKLGGLAPVLVMRKPVQPTRASTLNLAPLAAK